ncbi:MAG TPA: hypothetical protein VEZ50_10025 [Nodosilinea sp.]|nr:hypothetical protein [Nodosilinea sp.]
MAAKLAYPLCHRRRPRLVGWALAVVAGVAIAGCRPSPPPPTEGIAPSPMAPPPTAPDAPSAQPAPPTPPAATPTTPSNTPSATLPNTLVPNALIREWQPLSNVLLAFGSMTLTPNQVRWGSGQASPYTLVSTEGGYLLRLEANPSFYDNQNQYIKLIPKAAANGIPESLDVAFYTDASQLQSDEYIMYGGYFAE